MSVSQIVGIKSTQRGSTNHPATTGTVNVTISAVNLAKASLRVNGTTFGSGDPRYLVRGELTSTTNLALYKDATLAGASTVSWEVTEEY